MQKSSGYCPRPAGRMAVLLLATWSVISGCNPQAADVQLAPCPVAVCGASAAVPKFVYMAAFLAPSTVNVAGFAVDAATGDLTPVPGLPTPTGTGNNLQGIGIDPLGRYVFAADSAFPANIFSFPVNADGSLGTPSTTLFSIAINASQAPLVVDPTGRFLYVLAGSNTKPIYGFSIGAGGVLTPTPGSPYNSAVAQIPIGFAMDPSGQYLLVGTGSGVFMYAANTAGPTADGSVTYTGATVSAGLTYLGMDPLGQFLALGIGSSMQLVSVATTPTPSLAMAGSAQTGCFSGTSVPVFEPLGRYVFSGCTSDAVVYSLPMDRTAPGLGARATALPIGSMNTPQQLATAGNGEFVYSNISTSPQGYRMDAATGIGTATPGSPFAMDPSYSFQAPMVAY